MAIYEEKNTRPESRDSEETKRSRFKLVPVSQGNAIDYLGWEINDPYPGDSNLRIINIRTERFDPTRTTVIAEYSTRTADEQEEITDPEWSYSVDAVSETILLDENAEMIGADGEGTEKVFPNATATCRVYRRKPRFDQYLATVGKVNHRSFNGSAVGTYLYLGFDAAKMRMGPGVDRWDITHRFAFKNNGWRYNWFYYRKKLTVPAEVSATVEIRRAIGSQQQNLIYVSADYDALEI